MENTIPWLQVVQRDLIILHFQKNTEDESIVVMRLTSWTAQKKPEKQLYQTRSVGATRIREITWSPGDDKSDAYIESRRTRGLNTNRDPQLRHRTDRKDPLMVESLSQVNYGRARSTRASTNLVESPLVGRVARENGRSPQVKSRRWKISIRRRLIWQSRVR